MKMRTKVIVAMRQWLVAMQSSTSSVVGMRPDVVLLKFAMSEDH